jgi:hypothetical protein
MYDLFRNSMRVMLNKVKHIDKKKRIEDLVYSGGSGSGSGDYNAIIREIMQLCREMGDPMIHFTAMQPAALEAFISEHQFKPASTAFMRCISADSRVEYGANSCMRVRAENPADEDCTIILPHKNLINGIDNRTFYYGKLADELLRYTRIRRFILSSAASFASLTPIQYDLHPDEIVLFYSQLEAYFENLEPGGGIMNRFARYNTFYTANPDQSICANRPGSATRTTRATRTTGCRGGRCRRRRLVRPSCGEISHRARLCALFPENHGIDDL